MKKGLDLVAADFLELASEQRLEILSRLYSQNQKVSVIAKEIEATVPEVFRNFERLAKAGLISKESDGSYAISTSGRLMYSQISLVKFLSENKKYLKAHGFSDISDKFLQRIGALEGGEHVRGFVKVLEKWRTIYENAETYIYNVLFEVPYTADFIEPIAKKAGRGVRVRSVFSNTAIIPSDRKQVFEKHGFRKLIEEGKVERRMREDVKTIVILNEKESCVMFPSSDGSPDMGEGFYSKDPRFHEWCLDYFTHCWGSAGPFSESKLKST
ncbi:MAG: ArsR family transcriptional regulator [Thaumarchaeota archaeon]|nr:ArsR family transcriptional regulator [Nitrososphaerota archaeon]